jgi:hypothetical protein
MYMCVCVYVCVSQGILALAGVTCCTTHDDVIVYNVVCVRLQALEIIRRKVSLEVRRGEDGRPVCTPHTCSEHLTCLHHVFRAGNLAAASLTLLGGLLAMFTVFA